MTTLTDIETLTKDFADRRQKLADKVQALQDQIELAKRKQLPKIRALAEDMAVAHEELYGAIKDAPGLFKKPKTKTIAGIRVGFKKDKGKNVIEDEQRTIDLIKRLLPSQAEVLIKTEEKVLKSALDQLPVGDLKRLGVKVTDDVDAVFIKPIGDDIDKFVSALLAESERILREVA